MEKAKRIQELDILKGFGILFMVFNHVGWGDTVHAYFQSFHMPLFFIVSGYLWKSSEERISSRFGRKFTGLMLPYFFFGGILAALYTVDVLINDPGGDIWKGIVRFLAFPTDGIPQGGPLWFLPCMLFTDLFYTVINRLCPSKKAVGLVCVFTAALGCAYASISGMPTLPWCLEPTLTALLFMFIGDMLKNHDKWEYDPIRISAAAVALFFIIHIGLALSQDAVDLRTARYYNCAAYFLVSVLGTLVWWNISHRMEECGGKVMETLKKPLILLSSNAITFICLNRVLITCFDGLLGQFFDGDGTVEKYAVKFAVFLLTMGACALVHFILLHTPFKMLVGK